MATLEHLEAQGYLIRYVADLEHWEMPERQISCVTNFDFWIEAVLSNAGRKRGRNLSPYEQVEQIFYEFVKGKPLVYDLHCKKLDPLPKHIWELKTEDVRVFGWFPRKGHFIAACGEFKDRIPRAKLYRPYIQKVFDFRAGLNLDEPKAITGVRLNDIL